MAISGRTYATKASIDQVEKAVKTQIVISAN